MTFWLELHCDVRRDGCRNHQNETPMVLLSNAEVRSGPRLLALDARKKGWRFRRSNGMSGWVCPPCQEAGE